MPSIQNPDKTENITIRCSADLKRAVRIAAAEKDTSIEDLCADLLSAGLAEAKSSEAKKRRTG